MKVIDLLNKIAKGNIPKKVKYDGNIYKIEDCLIVGKEYQCKDEEGFTMILDFDIESLNDEVEIIEEKEMCHKCHKYPAEYNQTYCEFCLDISKLEEKKIPEELKDIINDGCIEAPNNFILMDKINEIIDYLKSKGE